MPHVPLLKIMPSPEEPTGPNGVEEPKEPDDDAEATGLNSNGEATGANRDESQANDLNASNDLDSDLDTAATSTEKVENNNQTGPSNGRNKRLFPQFLRIKRKKTMKKTKICKSIDSWDENHNPVFGQNESSESDDDGNDEIPLVPRR